MFERVNAEVEDHKALEQAEQAMTEYEEEQHQNHEAVTEAYFLQNTITLTEESIQVNKINNESDIATKAQGIDIVTKDLTAKNTTKLPIQNNKALPNQATACHHQGTQMRQPTKHAVETEAVRQHKQARQAWQCGKTECFICYLGVFPKQLLAL